MATLEDFKVFMEKVSFEAGLAPLVPSEDGLLQLSAGEIELVMQFIPSAGKIFIYSEIGYLPENAPSSIYRRLLTDQAGGIRTGGGCFAIIEATGNLIYQRLYDFAPSEPAAFAQMLADILDFTQEWQNNLASMLNGEPAETESTASMESPLNDLMQIRI